MSLALYLDDCAYSRRLRQMLIEAGHDVQVPGDVEPPLTGADDQMHFAHARKSRRAILAFNARDFKAFHDQSNDHFGVLAVHQDNDSTKDMSYIHIVRGIGNLERTGAVIAGGFWVLNAYRW